MLFNQRGMPIEMPNVLEKRVISMRFYPAYFLGKTVEMASFKGNRVGLHNYSTPLCGLSREILSEQLLMTQQSSARYDQHAEFLVSVEHAAHGLKMAGVVE